MRHIVVDMCVYKTASHLEKMIKRQIIPNINCGYLLIKIRLDKLDAIFFFLTILTIYIYSDKGNEENSSRNFVMRIGRRNFLGYILSLLRSLNFFRIIIFKPFIFSFNIPINENFEILGTRILISIDAKYGLIHLCKLHGESLVKKFNGRKLPVADKELCK